MQMTLAVGEGDVTVDYELAAQVVVFSHGFGVRRDARGMFTDLIAALPSGWGYVLFDYDDVAATNRQQVVGLNERLQRLQAVLDWTAQQAGVQQTHIIGHSMGSLTVASLAPAAMGTVLLLAPPLSLGSRFAEHYTMRPTASHDGHTWQIPRTDGTTTIVDDDQLAELMSADAEGELTKLALFRPYTIILAGVDEIVPDADYTELITMPSVNMVTVERADHDFSSESRVELIEAVLHQLPTTDDISRS